MLLHTLGAKGSGGAETYFLKLLEALNEAGLAQAVVLKPERGRDLAIDHLGVPKLNAPFRRFDLTTARRIKRFGAKVDATFCLAWMSRAASLLPRGPWTNIGRLGGYYDLRFFRGCDYLVTNTSDLRDYTIREGWSPSRVEFIPNFVSTLLGEPLERDSFSTPPDVPLLLCLGRLHPEKGHDIALRALARIPDAWLWIAGSGPYEAHLRALAHDVGVSSRVCFLGWRDDASRLMRTADVCVFPSRAEPFGNVVLEAWALGLPVVATDSVGPRTLIDDGADGLLTPIDDVDALAAAIRSLLNSPAFARRLTDAGSQKAREQFGKQAICAKWVEYLGSLEAPRMLASMT